VFWLNVPAGLALVVIGRRALAESRGLARRLDLAGLALATGAVFAFTDGLLRGPAVGWGSAARGALRSPRPTGAGPAAHAEISLPASYPDISQEI